MSGVNGLVKGYPTRYRSTAPPHLKTLNIYNLLTICLKFDYYTSKAVDVYNVE